MTASARFLAQDTVHHFQEARIQSIFDLKTPEHHRITKMLNAEDYVPSSANPGLTKSLLMSMEGLPLPSLVSGKNTDRKNSIAGAQG